MKKIIFLFSITSLINASDTPIKELQQEINVLRTSVDDDFQVKIKRGCKACGKETISFLYRLTRSCCHGSKNFVRGFLDSWQMKKDI